MRFATCATAVVTGALVVATVSSCARPAMVERSRQLLGTAITVTAYGDDEDALQAVVENAFEEMEAVAIALDAYDPSSSVSAFNAEPFSRGPLPDEFVKVLETIRQLGVEDAFSPTLLGVTALYDFGGEGVVPDPGALATAVEAATTLEETDGRWRFSEDGPTGGPLPGIDPGGAAKGLALDRAAAVLATEPSLTGALATAGSTTIAIGVKPDGDPWRIGVEDPRDTGTIVAVVEAGRGPFVVSTSGDYQQFFERDGQRYHHILDPATGRPAEGVRSVTVASVGASALEVDILSTALFVRGDDAAQAYAGKNALALYLVDDEGRASVTPGPEDSGLAIEEREEPSP